MCVNHTLAVLLDQSVFSNYRRCGKTIGLASGVLSWEIKEERSVQGIWLEPEEDDEMSTDLAGIWDERGSRRWA